MSFIHFRDWFNKEPIQLDEAVNDGSEESKALNVSDKAVSFIDKYPEYWNEICTILGPAVSDTGISEVEESDYKGFFLKTGSVTGVDIPSLYQGFMNDKDKWGGILSAIGGVVKSKYIYFQLSDETWVKIYISGSGSPKSSKYKYLPANLTSLQECIWAVVLEGLFTGKNYWNDIKNYEPPYVQLKKGIKYGITKNTGWTSKAAFIHDNPIWCWFDSTFDTPDSGLAKFFTFKKTPSNEEELLEFKAEMRDFAGNPGVSNTWASTFENVIRSNVVTEIKNVFNKTPVGVNWKNAKFYHHARKDITVDGLRTYLLEARCGQAKDTVDKSDIVLGFNPNTLKKHIKAVNAMKDIEEHNAYLNTAMNNMELIGISLKKISEVNPKVAAVNLFSNEVNTNASGPNINPKKMVAVKTSDNPLNCTFLGVNPSKDIKWGGKNSHEIDCLIRRGHEHDLHTDGNIFS